MPKSDVSRDFMNLSCLEAWKKSQEVHLLLCEILENCLKDSKYQEMAIENLLAYAEDDGLVKDELIKIASNTNSAYSTIQPLAISILKPKDKNKSPTLFGGLGNVNDPLDKMNRVSPTSCAKEVKTASSPQSRKPGHTN